MNQPLLLSCMVPSLSTSSTSPRALESGEYPTLDQESPADQATHQPAEHRSLWSDLASSLEALGHCLPGMMSPNPSKGEDSNQVLRAAARDLTRAAQVVQRLAAISETRSSGVYPIALSGMNDDAFAATLQTNGEVELNNEANETTHRSGFFPSKQPRQTMVIGEDCRWFQIEGKEVVSLQRRLAMRKLLSALIAASEAGRKEPLSVEEMFEIGWPEQRASSDSAAGRVYTTVRLLRAMGLRDVILSDAGGYIINPNLAIQTA
jgi:hypothetical protein